MESNAVAKFSSTKNFTCLGRERFVFIICLKHIFLTTTKFGGAQKIVWAELPQTALVSTGLG